MKLFPHFILFIFLSCSLVAKNTVQNEQLFSWHYAQWKTFKEGVSQEKFQKSLGSEYKTLSNNWDFRAVYKILKLQSKCGNYYIQAEFFPNNPPLKRSDSLQTKYTPDQLKLVRMGAGVILKNEIQGKISHEVYHIVKQDSKWIRGKPITSEGKQRAYQLSAEAVNWIANNSWNSTNLLADMRQSEVKLTKNFKFLRLVKASSIFMVEGSKEDHDEVEKYLKIPLK